MRPTQAGVRSLKSANSISQSLSSKAQKPKGKKANLLAQELSKANQPKFKGLRRTATLDLYGLPANTPLASIIEGIDQNSIYKIVPELDKGKLKLKFWDRKQSVNVAQHLYDTKYKAWTESGAKVIIPHKYGHSVPHSAIAPIFARNASRQVILPTIPGVSVTQRFTNASKFGPIEKSEMDQTTGNMKIRYMSFVDALKAVNDMPEARFPEPESDVSPKPDDVDASQFVRLWAPLPDAQISPELTDDKLKKDFGVFGGVTGVKWAENKQHLELEFPELRLASRAIDFFFNPKAYSSISPPFDAKLYAGLRISYGSGDPLKGHAKLLPRVWHIPSHESFKEGRDRALKAPIV